MFDFDEAVYRLECLFEMCDEMEEEDMLWMIDTVLGMCGADEDTDPDEMIEAVSTAAHNANVGSYIGRILGVPGY